MLTVFDSYWLSLYNFVVDEKFLNECEMSYKSISFVNNVKTLS